MRVAAEPVEPATLRQPVQHEPLIEALTWREIEILQLLEARLSNKEIGSALVISTETVKKYAANLYRKLDVTRRREAVARARALGFLSGEAVSVSA